jgi:hypothetical protein
VTNPLWKPPAAIAIEPDRSLMVYRTIAVVGFYAAFALQGALAGAPDGLQLVASFSMASAATMWCTVDAAARGDYYPHSLRWVTMVVWPLALPTYVIQTRRWRGLLMVVVAILVAFVVEAIGMLTARMWRGSLTIS